MTTEGDPLGPNPSWDWLADGAIAATVFAIIRAVAGSGQIIFEIWPE